MPSLNPMAFLRAAKAKVTQVATDAYTGLKARATEFAQSERAQSIKASVVNAANRVKTAVTSRIEAVKQNERVQRFATNVSEVAAKLNPLQIPAVRSAYDKAAAFATRINPMPTIRNRTAQAMTLSGLALEAMRKLVKAIVDTIKAIKTLVLLSAGIIPAAAVVDAPENAEENPAVVVPPVAEEDADNVVEEEADLNAAPVEEAAVVVAPNNRRKAGFAAIIVAIFAALIAAVARQYKAPMPVLANANAIVPPVPPVHAALNQAPVQAPQTFMPLFGNWLNVNAPTPAAVQQVQAPVVVPPAPVQQSTPRVAMHD